MASSTAIKPFRTSTKFNFHSSEVLYVPKIRHEE